MTAMDANVRKFKFVPIDGQSPSCLPREKIGSVDDVLNILRTLYFSPSLFIHLKNTIVVFEKFYYLHSES
jgi:hypothetical protein